jgi:hypothetical protein
LAPHHGLVKIFEAKMLEIVAPIQTDGVMREEGAGLVRQ